MKKFLACMPHAQAYVKREGTNPTTILMSYQTEAASITPDGWLTIHCWCSPTTRRHIAAFMDEYIHGIKSKSEQSRANTGSYQTAKALYEGHMKMDIKTGEIVDLEPPSNELVEMYGKI